MFAPRLKSGDTVRVIAPSGSFLTPWITEERKTQAKQRLEALGFRVTFGKHVNVIDDFCSSPVAGRLEDLHDAFADPTVTLVLAARGGFNSNQLLKYIDYDLIRKNPKALCGFSDITALAHAITVKSGLVTYSGPSYFNFGQTNGIDYTVEHFKKCVFGDAPFDVAASAQWFDDGPGGDKKSHANAGPIVIHPGTAEGPLLGANACTLNMLQGTEYFPDLTGCVLFVEDDYESQPHHFNSHLQSLILLPSFRGVKGLVIGRFESKSAMNDDLIRKSIATYGELKNIPVIANVDFGHTQPLCTFPIGGRVRMEAKEDGSSQLTIITH